MRAGDGDDDVSGGTARVGVGVGVGACDAGRATGACARRRASASARAWASAVLRPAQPPAWDATSGAPVIDARRVRGSIRLPDQGPAGAMLDDDDVRGVVHDARRAPSAHNTQPARWRREGRALSLYEDPTRRLVASDPTGRDQRVGLGAAIESTVVALSTRGLVWRVERAASSPSSNARPAATSSQALGLVASGVVERGGAPDPLAAALASRATWRGPFDPASPAAIAGLTERLGARVVVVDRATIERAAVLVDDATLRAMRVPGCFSELLAWLRLSDDHPGYARDGMNREALALSRVEALGARALMRPGVLRAGPLARAVLSEARQVRSATALVLVDAPPDEDPLDTGRRFARTWLEIEAAGLSACPMSALADDDEARAEIARRVGLGDRRLVNVFRVGAAPPHGPWPRLPVAELIA